MSEAPQSRNEIEDLIEHLERYRATTLQVLDLVDGWDLSWRPSPDQYSLGQQLYATPLPLGERPDVKGRVWTGARCA